MSRAAWLARWQALAARIDALSLRERVFLFLAITALMLALLDALLFKPLDVARQARAQALAQSTQSLKELRQQLTSQVAVGLGKGPEQALEAQLRDLAQQQARTQAALAHAWADQAQAPQLPQVLTQLLQSHARVRLLKLESFKGAPPNAGALGLPDLHWSGLELQLSGEYADLTQYLSALEQAMPTLNWGEMQVKGKHADRPTQLHLRLYLLQRRS